MKKIFICSVMCALLLTACGGSKKTTYDFTGKMIAPVQINNVDYTEESSEKPVALLFGENNTISYELKLPTDAMFAKVHGDMTLHYTVYEDKNIVLLETITPEDILSEGHRTELPTYKGVMISKANAEKDMFKINLLNMLQK